MDCVRQETSKKEAMTGNGLSKTRNMNLGVFSKRSRYGETWPRSAKSYSKLEVPSAIGTSFKLGISTYDPRTMITFLIFFLRKLSENLNSFVKNAEAKTCMLV